MINISKELMLAMAEKKNAIAAKQDISDIDIKLNKNEVKFVVVDKELKYMILIIKYIIQNLMI